jgi:hypothetical protein
MTSARRPAETLKNNNLRRAGAEAQEERQSRHGDLEASGREKFTSGRMPGSRRSRSVARNGTTRQLYMRPIGQRRLVSKLRVADLTAERVRHEHAQCWLSHLYEPLGVSKGQHARHWTAFEDPCTDEAPVLLRGGMTQHFSGLFATTINSHLHTPRHNLPKGHICAREMRSDG